jgi:hypothetical protein
MNKIEVVGEQLVKKCAVALFLGIKKSFSQLSQLLPQTAVSYFALVGVLCVG